MFDFLWSGGSNSTPSPTRAPAVPPSPTNLIPRSDLPAAQRCVGVACGVGTLGISKTHHYHPAEHIPPHIHVHNVSHAHSLIFLGNPNRTIWHNYSYPHQHGGGHAPGQGFQGFPGGFGGALSSWYQLNLGLIGIGALAVVAIIGSRNFFSNYVYYKKSKYDSEYYDYEQPYDYGGYYRRDWYDEWYDRWYREHGSYAEDEHDDHNGYNDHRFGGDQKGKYPYKSRYKRDLHARAKQETPYVDTGQPPNRSGQNRQKKGQTVTDGLGNKPNKTEAQKSTAHCGFRLTCDLTRERKRMLSEVEWNLLRQTRFKQIGVDVFKVHEDDGKSSGPAMADYNVAQRLGVHGFACEKLSGSCPLRPWQIRRMLSQFNKKLKLSEQLKKNVKSNVFVKK